MIKKLNCILLIDDDDAANFIHNRVIQKSGCTQHVAVARNGQEAIDYLTTSENGVYPQPDLIFLDINMPVMNGWEFLDAYEHLEKEQKGGELIVMLTTSLNPDDKEKAKNIPHINDFHPKPLNVENLNKILENIMQ